MSTTTYRARCWRDEDGWWIIEVPGVPGVVSEARRLDQVEVMAADALALALDTTAERITVEVVPELDDQRSGIVDSFVRDSRDAERARVKPTRPRPESAPTWPRCSAPA